MAKPRAMGGSRRKASPAATNRSRSNQNQKRTLDLAAASRGSKKRAIDDAADKNDHTIDSSDEDSDDMLKTSHKKNQFRSKDEPSLHDESNEEDDDDEEEDKKESLDVKRVRLAREYLQKLDAQSDESSSASASASDEDDNESEEMGEHDDDKDTALSRKLQRDRLKKQGALERDFADKLQQQVAALQLAVIEERPALLTPEEAAKQWIKSGHVKLLSGHDLTPTCIAIDQAGQRAISGSKDHSVIIWDLENKCRLTTLAPAWSNDKKDKKVKKSRLIGQVLAVALSDDGRFAAIGKKSGVVDIYDLSRPNGSKEPVKTFEGHKKGVTALAFRTQSHQLFSGSEDRCIRYYSLDEMMYMETLYGHQFGVNDIDCHLKERPISVGQDRTVRAWKLTEDTHLIFRGGSKIQSAQAIAIIKDDWFLTAHEGGHLSLWVIEKKKAVASVENAHGVGHDIVSVATVKGSDVAATGSYDGYLRLWRIMTGPTLKERGIEPIGQIPVRGYINSIAFGPKARYCIAAIGQEHRLGRWNRVQGAKNRIAIINLQASSEKDDDEAIDNGNEQEHDPATADASESDMDE